MFNIKNVNCFALIVCVFFGVYHSSVASVIVVSNVNDAGAGSLRQAITDANVSVGYDTIQFSVSGTIGLTIALPSITGGLLIDGYTATGYVSGTPSLAIDGNGATNVVHFIAGSGQSILRGLRLIDGTNAVFINSVDSIAVVGCWMGIDATGVAAEGALATGVRLENSNRNTLGGLTSQERNVIASCSSDGVKIQVNSDHNTLQGNYIGLGSDGSTALGNLTGIYIDDSDTTTIGGATYTSRNIISDNTDYGIRVTNGSIGTIIKSNFIGTTVTGLVGRGNGKHGVSVFSNSHYGSIGGSNLEERNVMGDNGENGIAIEDSDWLQVVNNFSGVDSTGNTGLGNGFSGLSFTRSENSVAQGNVLSGNSNEGIWMTDSDSLSFTGNYIGVGEDGTTALGNGQEGVRVNSSTYITIGGDAYGERNVIADNSTDGIRFESSTDCVAKGNFVGVSATGVSALGNSQRGIFVSNGSHDVIIGGNTDAERNVISSNGDHGVYVENSNDATIENNYCGTDSSGTTAIANDLSGISFFNSSGNSIVSNLLSGNDSEGLRGENIDNSIISKNLIGVASDTTTLPNGTANNKNGIEIGPGSTGNTIGGSLVNANLVAYNHRNGIDVYDGSNNTNANLVTHNSVYCNGAKGINIFQAQNNIAVPVTTVLTADAVTGTATAGNTIHVYQNQTIGATCDCEGESYLGSVVADGSGDWTLNHGLGLTAGEVATITATQTDGSNNTSEFNTCNGVLLPVIYQLFFVEKQGGYNRLLWATNNEINNDRFEIEKSSDGVNFMKIGEVSGMGHSHTLKEYQWDDFTQERELNSHYRLRQVDFNGRHQYSPVVVVSNQARKVLFYPNPTTIHSGIRVNKRIHGGRYELLDVMGHVVADGFFNADHVQFDDSVIPGVYYLKLYQENSSIIEIEQLVIKS